MNMPPVLVVEDEEYVRQALAEALKGPYEVFQAEDGLQALEALNGREFALVFLDIALPEGADGLQLLSLIRQRWPRCQIIMMTGVNDVQTVLKCLDQGAFDYLNKPPDLAELLAVASRAMDKWSRARILESKASQDPGAWSRFHTAVDSLELPVDLRITVSEMESRLIVKALKQANGNRSEAARLLNLHRNSLNLKIRLLNIQAGRLEKVSFS